MNGSARSWSLGAAQLAKPQSLEDMSNRLSLILTGLVIKARPFKIYTAKFSNVSKRPFSKFTEPVQSPVVYG